MSEFPPIADLVVPAEILDIVARLPEPPYRYEEHVCRWREIPTDGRPFWQCSLTWSDGTPCGSVASEPTAWYPASRMVRIGDVTA